MEKQLRITIPQEASAKSFKVNVIYQLIEDGPYRREIRGKIPEDQDLPDDLKIREFVIEKTYTPGYPGVGYTGYPNKTQTDLDANFVLYVEGRISEVDDDLRNWEGFIRP